MQRKSIPPSTKRQKGAAPTMDYGDSTAGAGAESSLSLQVVVVPHTAVSGGGWKEPLVSQSEWQYLRPYVRG